ncbi:uncharacterized protein LOC122848731 isoform X2 [Aphidius gifuensis]|uniref:uncharacterized protein LOC122848731 isoform X2 n=1 Tax=Aphidius gifuensis TaxID=684658 RepID=UPI001CDC9105|nr:uncharacterized protein LOC122848731 isoform X2 [Aphidius gifuensis]
MKGGGQLGLLLWKNYVVRKRQTGVLGLIFLWPIVIFLLLYILRKNVDTEDNPTCQFPARLMPRDGLLPFAQSFICSISNPCEPLENYEEIPSYKKAKLGPLIMDLQPVLNNKTILTAVGILPKSVKLLRSMIETLTVPDIKQMFVGGLLLSDLFVNVTDVKDSFNELLPDARENLVNDLFDTPINLINLVDPFESSDLEDNIFVPETLEQFLAAVDKEDMPKLSRALRNVDTNQIPLVFDQLIKNLDWSRFSEIVNNITATLESYNLIDDITITITKILDLDIFKNNIPTFLKLRERLPEMLSLFKDFNLQKIDYEIVHELIEKLDSTLDDSNVSIARESMLKFMSLLELIKKIEYKNFKFDNSMIFTLDDSKEIDQLNLKQIKRVASVIDDNYIMSSKSDLLMRSLPVNNTDEIELAAKLFDNLLNVLSEDTVNSLTYILSMLDNVFQLIQHIFIVHGDMEEKIYNITKNHRVIVDKIMAEVNPKIYRNIISSFMRLDFAEKFAELSDKQQIAEVVCNNTVDKLIFHDKLEKLGAVDAYDLICSDEGKQLITDIYNLFEFNKFKKIIKDTVFTFISMKLHRPLKKNNFTSSIESIREFFYYNHYSSAKILNWNYLFTTVEWKNIYNETYDETKISIFGYYLSIVKLIVTQSYSLEGLKLNIEKVDLIADKILENLNKISGDWVSQVYEYKSELLESFYSTVYDKKKMMKILEFSNFTRSYCSVESTSELINYPIKSNAKFLKSLVCRLAMVVQKLLNISIDKLESLDKTSNFTLINKKLVLIYAHIVKQSQIDNHNLINYLDEFRKNLTIAWTTNLNSADGLQISVGLLYKLFDIGESPLFNIQASAIGKNLYALAMSFTSIADNIEQALDEILKFKSPERLNKIIQNMPESKIFLDAIFHDRLAIVQDIVDIFNQKISIQPVQVMKNYLENDMNRACSDNQNFSKALEYQPEKFQQQIDRISCNKSHFIKEFNEHSNAEQVHHIVSDEKSVLAFNWTSGYVDFRRLVNKFLVLMKNDNSIDPKLTDISVELKKLITNYESEKRMNALLDYIDAKIDESIPIFQSNFTVENTWMSIGNPRGPNDILIMAKFASKIIHDAISVILNSFQSQTKSINILRLFGIGPKSPFSLFRNHFHDIFATLLYGITDKNFEYLIYHNTTSKDSLTCSKLFSWFFNYKIGLTVEEYWSLKNFTCDRDYNDFNDFLNLYIKQIKLWKTPVINYQNHFVRLPKDISDFINVIKKIQNGTIKISPLVDNNYWKIIINNLKNLLEAHNLLTRISATPSVEFRWSRYRLVIEALSQVLKNAADVLKHNKINDNELHLWNMVKPGDIHELLKYLEEHPIETISFIATLGSLNLTMTSETIVSELKYSMCSLHFNHSEFWHKSQRKYFLTKLCTYDVYQLLSSVTNEEYADYVAGRSTSLQSSEPLAICLFEFLDAWINVNNNSGKNLQFKSNIINTSTWLKLPDEAKSLISDSQNIVMHKIFQQFNLFNNELKSSSDIVEIYNTFGDSPLGALWKIIHVGDIWTDIVTSEDAWGTLKNLTIKNQRLKIMLNLIEDMPNLFISTIDTYLNSERLTDFLKKIFSGQVNACEISKYLIPSKYIKKKNIISSITDFCQFIVSNNKQQLLNTSMEEYFQPLLPANFIDNKNFLFVTETINDKGKKKFHVSLNESYFFVPIKQFQTILLRIFSQDNKLSSVPSWLTSFEKNTLHDFKKQLEKRDTRVLAHSAISKSMKIIKEILFTPGQLKTLCSSCNTHVLEIINSQLADHQIYTDILCKFSNITTAEIQDIIDKKLYWKKTIGMIRNYKYLNKKKDVESFITAIQSTLHYLTDIIINYNTVEKNNIKDCMLNASKSMNNIYPNFYVNFIIQIIDVLKKNVKILDTSANHDLLIECTRLIEKSIANWIPLENIVMKTKINDVKKYFPNAKININLLLDKKNNFICMKNHDKCDIKNLEIFLNTKEGGKLIKYDSIVSNYPTTSEIAKILFKNIDYELIKREQLKASSNLSWLENILDNMSIIFVESLNLFDTVNKIDFKDVSSVLDGGDVADSVVSLLKNQTIDKLFNTLRNIPDYVNLFFNNKQDKYDLESLVDILESMKVLKNLISLNIKYKTSEMFSNWNEIKKFLANDINLSNETIQIFGKSDVNMLSIIRKKREIANLKDTFCSLKTLQSLLNFNNSKTNAEEVSKILCSLDEMTIQNITVALVKNVNYAFVIKILLNVNMDSMLRKADLTKADAKIIFDNIAVIEEIVPFFQQKLSFGLFINLPSTKQSSSSDSNMSSGQFLQDASKLMCGHELLSDNGQFYRLISSLKDNNKYYDDMELNSLPTDFCRNIYKNVLTMTGGKIIWSYVKPLLRGRILYTPNSLPFEKVMGLANQTFIELENLQNLMLNLEKTLTLLASLGDMGDKLKDFKEVMDSEVMKIAIKSMSKGKFNGEFFNHDFSQVAWILKKSIKIVKMLDMLNNLLDCILVNRIVGLETEEKLEEEAKKLTNTNEFLAGVVFIEDKNNKLINENSNKIGKSIDDNLPINVTYKIRMDIDFVPSTKRIKNQFWLPGPESSFIEDLRYLRGFVQIQDSIDRSIIEIKTGKTSNWKTLSQQMPYPCWKFAPFQSTLYESQGLILCFFFALMLCAGATVRNAVWERESQNAMVMSVMGLKPWRNTFAWFITSIIELTIVAVSICLILIVGKILPNSNPILLMILLMDYVFSIITFCYMISTFFSSASLAAITTVVTFLLTYLPFIIVISMQATWHGTLALGYNLLLCLSMSTSFCYGLLYAARREVQGTGLTWETIWDRTSSHDQMSLGIVLLMIALDGCIYAVIGYLIDRYTNSGFQQLRSRSLWWDNNSVIYGHQSYLSFVNSLYFTNDALHISSNYQDEASDSSSIIVSEKYVGVSFEGVKKSFKSERGEIIAVNDFTLKLRGGEVTSLLGRNGAGKTTIIKMLTGMLKPTCGEIHLNGVNGTKANIGVCPQNNVLIESLTPREHMNFYAILKGSMNEEEIDKNVNNMMISLELGKQEHELVSRLSGGTKRRLCVALAFIGSPNLVILDEPGAGVDPAARRRIWRLIDQHRSNRTILLSTHHLDEADMLSDTVVIMHRGNILCTGSPLTLKKTYGQGYWINMAFSHDELKENDIELKQKNIISLVENVAQNGKTLVNDNFSVATEVSINIPFNDKNGATNDIEKVLHTLEDNENNLKFSRMSLECDTLEHVFLNLCSKSDEQKKKKQETQVIIGVDNNAEFMTKESIIKPSSFRQIKALLKKRFWHFSRDWRAPIATLILPTIFVAFAMGFSLVRPPSGNEPAMDLSPKLYGEHSTFFYSIDNNSDVFLQHVLYQIHDQFIGKYEAVHKVQANDTGTCECTDGNQICQGVAKSVEGLVQTLHGPPTLEWIVSTLHEYIEKRYGGWSLSHLMQDPVFIVWFNNKGYHSLPSFLNALNDAILRASGNSGHLKTINHPIKLSSDQLNRTTLLQHVADIGIALVLLTAFSLVAAQGTKELVRERISEEKRILYLAGVHPVTYWTSTLVWDFFIFLCSIGCAIIVFEIFGLPAYVARDNLLGICIILFLFAWGAVPFAHLFEKVCNDSSISNMVLFCVNTFIGVFCLSTILIIDILGKSDAAKNAREILHNLMLLFPQYAFADAVIRLSTNDIAAELLQRFNMDTYKSPLGWDLLGPNYACMFIVGIIYYLINLAIECRIIPQLSWKKNNNQNNVNDEDNDVAEERIRVEKNTSKDLIKTIMLRKEYTSVYGKNIALKNLSIGIEAGTCFGLLGVNGAGKSTTFKMLTTELRPTSGRIIINNCEINGRPLCNGEIGYCPQGDALDGFLTPYQSLTIHGEICGLENVPRSVEIMLKRFDLVKYTHQRISSLSGGNKRKLCAAISVMAPVSVVLMDEPTSGMDPASKELVGHAVREIIKTQRCVIMTSHSVAECEKLCTRIGILAKAGLRCIGTVQHLKHKFGEGYVAFLRFNQPIEIKKINNSISNYFSMAKISSRQSTAARFLIPKNKEIKLSETFRKLKQVAEELNADDYTLTQSSLDQVLVNFSEELDDDSLVSENNLRGRVNFANSCSSMDDIHMETF